MTQLIIAASITFIDSITSSMSLYLLSSQHENTWAKVALSQEDCG